MRHENVAREAGCAQSSKHMARGVRCNAYVLALERATPGMLHGSIDPQCLAMVPLASGRRIDDEIVRGRPPFAVTQPRLQSTDYQVPLSRKLSGRGKHSTRNVHASSVLVAATQSVGPIPSFALLRP